MFNTVVEKSVAYPFLLPVQFCTVQYCSVLYSTITYLVPVDLRDGPAPNLDLADEPPAALAVHVVQPLPEDGRELETTSIKVANTFLKVDTDIPDIADIFGEEILTLFGKYFTNKHKLLKKHYYQYLILDFPFSPFSLVFFTNLDTWGGGQKGHPYPTSQYVCILYIRCTMHILLSQK